MLVASFPRQFYSALHGLRGLAALLVALHHYGSSTLLTASGIVRGAPLCVDFFFVLSGFVLASSSLRHDKPTNLIRFIKSRFWRIYPLHFFILTCFGFYYLSHFFLTKALGKSLGLDFNVDLIYFLKSLFLLEGLGFAKDLDRDWNFPAWSISVELWGSVLCAAAYIHMVFRRRGQTQLLVISLFSAACWIGLVLGEHVLSSMTTQTALLRFLLSFSLGFLTQRFFIRYWKSGFVQTEKRSVFGSTITEFCLLGAAVTCMYYTSPIVQACSVLVFSAAVYCFAGEAGLISKLLSLKPLQILGNVSYSIYLSHILIRMLFGFVLSYFLITPEPNVTLAVYFVIVLVVSWFLYRFIEIPGKKMPEIFAAVKKNALEYDEVPCADKYFAFSGGKWTSSV